MKLSYPHARLPHDDAARQAIHSAAARLYDKLNDLTIDQLDISDYNKRYLGNHLKNLTSTLQKHAYILAWSLACSPAPPAEQVLIDYGGGCGVLSLLAKELGTGTVAYSDIYDVSCTDAQLIAQAVHNEADHYIHGDVDAVIDFLRASAVSGAVVASYDVIEHIYDVEGFLAKLAELAEPPFRLVMASSANPRNRRIRQRLMAKQTRLEHEDRERQWGHKERDCLKAYLTVRKDIVADHAPALSDSEAQRLAQATRGLIDPDIRACVDAYLETGRTPRQPDYPTNTCDPTTGNWAEHLMDLDRLQAILAERGYQASVLPGYYGWTHKANRRLTRSLKNLLISALKHRGLTLAPFYTLFAERPVPVRP